MKGRFLNIEMRDETNVAVISLGEINTKTETEACDEIKKILTPKLTQVLAEHFDAEVTVVSANVFSVLSPIEVRCMISMEQDGETTVQEITLNETWVY